MARANDDSDSMTPEELEIENRYKLGGQILMLLGWGGLLLSALFGIIGVILVYLGASADTSIKLFGQTISSGSVGVSALFIAAVMFVVVVIRVLKAYNSLIQIGNKKGVPIKTLSALTFF